MVYALGFTLEKVAAMQEHGIKGQSPGLDTTIKVTYYFILVYFKGTWVGINLEYARLSIEHHIEWFRPGFQLVTF